MQPNAFIGRLEQPAESDLVEVLGPAKELWDRLLADLKAKWGLQKFEWKRPTKNSGWSLRAMRGDRNIVYLGPCRGEFLAAFVLGAKAVAAAHAQKLPARVRQAIDGGTQYPEGLGIRIGVRGERDLPVVRALTQLKLDH